MKTLKEIFTFSTDFLQKSSVLSPKRSAELILSNILGLIPLDIYLYFDKLIAKDKEKKIIEALLKRATCIPVEYILGKVLFYSCEIEVNRDVLIPRQETEIMVDLIVQKLKKDDLSNKILWDIGCGSGCIGIALKKKYPALHVVMSDICPKALEIAKINCLKNQVDIELIQGDLLIPFEGKKADYIVSNPPYISEKEFEELDNEVKNFEPKKALMGGKSGLEFYEQFSLRLPKFLKKNGKAFFEIGYKQKESIKKLFFNIEGLKGEVIKDYASNDRFFFLEIE